MARFEAQAVLFDLDGTLMDHDAIACERLGVEREQATHVGDRLDLDAQGAAAAGLRGIWLDRLGVEVEGAAAEVEGVARISSLRELVRAIGG